MLFHFLFVYLSICLLHLCMLFTVRVGVSGGKEQPASFDEVDDIDPRLSVGDIDDDARVEDEAGEHAHRHPV